MELCFKKEGVHGVVRDIFLPWYNVYRFLIQNAQRWEAHTGKTFQFDETILHNKANITNIMDRWIIAFMCVVDLLYMDKGPINAS